MQGHNVWTEEWLRCDGFIGLKAGALMQTSFTFMHVRVCVYENIYTYFKF